MVSPTRRALLHGAAGLAAGFAGCSGLLDGSAESTRTAPRGGSNGRPESGSVTDPETLLLRLATDRPPIWLATSNSEDSGRPAASERDRWREFIVVDDTARADRLDVADTVDRDQVESFLAATDFAGETVYVEMGAVEECFRLDLCYIGWTPTEISTDYTRQLRPYTERCEADELVVEARLVRIPDAIEAADLNSYSSSIGSGVCDRRRGHAEGEGGSEPSPASESDIRTETATIDSGGGQ
ncbi:hypothetical protein [Haloplanus salilacus]|uniref:hypothetical protein n=1 Tax=Haloplanus salilacus TaxID=2949994 RepID=UPI0030CE766C